MLTKLVTKGASKREAIIELQGALNGPEVMSSIVLDEGELVLKNGSAVALAQWHVRYQRDQRDPGDSPRSRSV